jgi:hypothetical protein
MSIPLSSNFDVNAALPLDARFIVADLTARDAIIAGKRYLGMLVYVISDTKTYQLKTGILNSDWIEFGSGGATINVEKFSGNGATTTFTLALNAGSTENTNVYISGIYQNKVAAYSLVTGTNIVFTGPPAIGVNNIEVVYATPVASFVLADGSVTTAKLANGAVTNSKLAVGAVGTTNIIAGSVGTTELADGAVTANKIGNGEITQFKIASLAVSEIKLNARTNFLSSISNFSTATPAYVDVGLSISLVRGADNVGKTVMVTLCSGVPTTLTQIFGTDFNIRLVKGSTVVGIYSYPAAFNYYSPSEFSWFDADFTPTAVIYKIQISTGNLVVLNNVRMSIRYI